MEIRQIRKWRKFRFRQKKLWPRNRYRDLILVSVADTETRFRSYTSLIQLSVYSH